MLNLHLKYLGIPTDICYLQLCVLCNLGVTMVGDDSVQQVLMMHLFAVFQSHFMNAYIRVLLCCFAVKSTTLYPWKVNLHIFELTKTKPIIYFFPTKVEDNFNFWLTISLFLYLFCFHFHYFCITLFISLICT